MSRPLNKRQATHQNADSSQLQMTASNDAKLEVMASNPFKEMRPADVATVSLPTFSGFFSDYSAVTTSIYVAKVSESSTSVPSAC